jgi:hypothetical protein
MRDVSWISARWMMIQNQTIMCLLGDNTTFTFKRSDCDWKKASDKKFNRGLGKPGLSGKLDAPRKNTKRPVT